jgi:hypothetical protein
LQITTLSLSESSGKVIWWLLAKRASTAGES